MGAWMRSSVKGQGGQHGQGFGAGQLSSLYPGCYAAGGGEIRQPLQGQP